MRNTLVLGERCTDIGEEMLGLDLEFHPDGRATFSGPMRIDGPLGRAIFRAEAELLLADAGAMASGRYEYRTPDQRRADAFVLLAERVGEAVKGMPKGKTSGHDPRGHRASDKKRRSA